MRTFWLALFALLSIGCVIVNAESEAFAEGDDDNLVSMLDLEIEDEDNQNEDDSEDEDEEEEDVDSDDEDEDEDENEDEDEEDLQDDDDDEEVDESAFDSLMNSHDALQLLQVSMTCGSCTRRSRNCIPCRQIRAANLRCQKPVNHRRVRNPLLSCNAIARLRGAITKRYTRKTKRLATVFMHMRTRLRALGQLNKRINTINVMKNMLNLYRTKKFQFNWMKPGTRMRNRVRWPKKLRLNKEQQVQKILKMLGVPAIDKNGNVIKSAVKKFKTRKVKKVKSVKKAPAAAGRK